MLNLQRVVQATIDLAGHMVKKEKLGIPQESRDVFLLLKDAQIISEELSVQLQNMVGFRNVAVHDYQRLNLDIVKDIVRHRLDDIIRFKDIILQRT